MTKVPRLPKPNIDNKYSESWLNDYIEARYTFHDDNFGQGAKMMFRDIMQMGLIRDERIVWDETEEVENEPCNT